MTQPQENKLLNSHEYLRKKLQKLYGNKAQDADRIRKETGECPLPAGMCPAGVVSAKLCEYRRQIRDLEEQICWWEMKLCLYSTDEEANIIRENMRTAHLEKESACRGAVFWSTSVQSATPAFTSRLRKSFEKKETIHAELLREYLVYTRKW